jgi:hypothetical protein
LLTMLGARWLPVPSSPWQPTQFEAKICCPRALLDEAVLDARFERDCCEDARSTLKKRTPITTNADTIENCRSLISRLVNSSASLRSLHEPRSSDSSIARRGESERLGCHLESSYEKFCGRRHFSFFSRTRPGSQHEDWPELSLTI